MPTISYAVTAHNEHQELDVLLQQLSNYKKEEDEIVVQLDTTATLQVKDVVSKHGLQAIEFPLNGDFAAFKNNLKDNCTKEYVFFLDADETVSTFLLSTVHEVLASNDQIELYWLPRVNTVEGLTQEHARKWRWTVDKQDRINWPDYQGRLVKNLPHIKWQGKVHERLTGAMIFTQLPSNTTQFALMHPKTIERQEKQNEFYDKL